MMSLGLKRGRGTLILLFAGIVQMSCSALGVNTTEDDHFDHSGIHQILEPNEYQKKLTAVLRQMNGDLEFSEPHISNPSSEEGQLKVHLLSRPDYNHDVRPRTSDGENTTISMSLAIRHIRDIDERQQTITINGWIRMSWTDHRLNWTEYKQNSSALRNLKFIRVFPTDIWLPDITLYNNYNAEQITPFGWTKALISDAGVVVWVPPVVFTAYCGIDLRYYPFDTQQCRLVLGSWTHDGYTLDLQHMSGYSDVDTSFLDGNAEWHVEGTSAQRVSKTYPCCPEPYITMEYVLTLRRQMAYFQYSAVLPCVLCMLLSLLTFWLPPDCREKVVYGALTMLTLALFFIYTCIQVPVSSGHVPVILRFYSFTLIMVAISLLLAAAVVKMYHRAPYRRKVVRPVPTWIRTVVLNGVARVLCLHRDRYQTLDDRHKSMSTDMATMGEESHVEDSNPESEGTSTFRQFVLEKQLAQSSEEAMIADWQLVAIVIDRVFFWLYLVAFSCSVVVIIVYE